MLQSLKDWFDTLLPPGAQAPGDAAHLLRLATAVLLVEVMRADSAQHESERAAVAEALRAQFALADHEVQALLGLALEASRGATDYFEFTSRINDSFDLAQKMLMIEHMWRVAYADGHLDAHENHVMRKIADLLYIPQGAYVNAKARAREAVAPGPAGRSD